MGMQLVERMGSPIIIRSGDEITDLNHHFRVFAGPGAGKTYWLMNHIRNVLRNSNRLGISSKIACITYTTVAAEHINEKLNESGNRVDISTIHSFLYKNIIKPYAHLLKNENGENLINFEEIDGHEEHKPSMGKIKTWIDNSPGNFRFLYAKNKKDTIKILSDLTWKLDASGKCRLDFQNSRLFPASLLKLAIEYKKLYWNEGRIHHEDVLYFSYTILKENPIIKQFISAKYPYIFIDEFQDTNPIQTAIMKWLAESGSTIGVIGDHAQSIYRFQGANREDFVNFSLKGQINYKIEDNWRSTQKIIDLLNNMRKEESFRQECIRKEIGKDVCVLISNHVQESVSIFKKCDNEKDIVILARDNKYLTKIKSEKDGDLDIWNNFLDIDYYRQGFFNIIFRSLIYADQGRFEIAIRDLAYIFKTAKNGTIMRKPLNGRISSEIKKRSIIITLLSYLVSNKNDIRDNLLIELYNKIDCILSSFDVRLKGVNSGKFREFAEKTKVIDLMNSLKVSEENRNIRTVHGSKGDEFDGVLLCLEKETSLKHIITPDMGNEECRIMYVALSRAKDLLYISVPTISRENEISLKKMGVNLIKLNVAQDDCAENNGTRPRRIKTLFDY